MLQSGHLLSQSRNLFPKLAPGSLSLNHCRHVSPRLPSHREYIPTSRPPIISARMSHWLLKTEPDEWGWDHQSAAGGLSYWDGVRNATAQKNMKAMQIGDLCFFYHTGKERAIVGIVKVVKEWYPEPQKLHADGVDDTPVILQDSNQKDGSEKNGLVCEDDDVKPRKKKAKKKDVGVKISTNTSDGVPSTGVSFPEVSKWGQVDVQEVASLSRPVSLQEIKAEAELGHIHDFVLLRQQRLSVLPVSDLNWTRICYLGALDSPPHVHTTPASEMMKCEKRLTVDGSPEREEKPLDIGNGGVESPGGEGSLKGIGKQWEKKEMTSILVSLIEGGTAVYKPKRKRTARKR